MMNRKDIGNIGEDIVSSYLIKKGWKILFRNYRRKCDEIDIIAITPDQTLVFCEVKTSLLRSEIDAEAIVPEDNLTANKLRKISRTCEFFARQNPRFINEGKGWRIDLLAVDIGSNHEASDIRHYENI